jgi:hypothetical protein
MKKGLCIIECVDFDDPGSEGRFLRELMHLMSIPCSLERVSTIRELLEALSCTEMKYVHVATHGAITDKKKFKGWWTKKGVGSPKTFNTIKPRTKCEAIISTACGSGCSGFAREVIEQMGAKNYIAPVGHPQFHNAALFSHIFYHKLFHTKRSVATAFDSYMNAYKNPHKFKLFAADKR